MDRNNHKLFRRRRARAVELMLIGELLSRRRFAAYAAGGGRRLMAFVIPNAVGRGYDDLEERCDTIVGLMVKSAILKALLASDA